MLRRERLVKEIVLRTLGVAPHFQDPADPRRPPGPYERPRQDPAGTGPERREAAAKAIAQGVKNGVGVTVDVTIVAPETLERSLGKLRRVKALRDQ